MTAAERTRRAFEQIVATSNGNWPISIDMPNSVQLGDSATVRYSSAYPGYASMFYVGSDNKDIKMIFGNLKKPATGSNLETIGTLPILEPVGANTFLFLMSATPIDTAALLNAAKDEKMKIDSNTLQQLQCAAMQQRNVGKFSASGTDAGCGEKRNAGVIDLQAPGVALNSISGFSAQTLSVLGRK